MPLSRVLLFLLFCTVLPAMAGEYVVSPRGADSNEGTAKKPWKTLTYACAQLTAGDLLIVKAGEYAEKLILKASGTADDGYITLRGEPGAIISGAGAAGKNLILVENQSFLRITGLELRDNLGVRDGSAIRVTGHGSHIELRNNRIHDIRGKDAMGITFYGTDPAQPLEQLVVDGNEIYNCDPAKSEALTFNGNISDFRVTNNLVHDVNNIGIDFIGGEPEICSNRTQVARNGVCRGNKVWRCRSTYGDGYAAGIYIDGGRDIIIEDNVVTQCDLGLEVGAENKGVVASGNVVRGNLLFRNDKAGLVFGGFDKSAGSVEHCQFLNNTCCDNNRHRKDQNGELWIQWASDNEVSGNTLVTDRDTPLIQVDGGIGQKNVINHNHYYGTEGVADVLYQWKDKDINGFAAWQRISGQDSDSVFGPVAVALPDMGGR